MRKEVEREFGRLCGQAGRRGVIGFVPVEGVRLLPEQSAYLRRKLEGLGLVLSEAEGAWSDITAVSIGLLYHESEILAIPCACRTTPTASRTAPSPRLRG